MFEQTLAIIRNTFLESVRQPIMLVVLMIATIAIVLSNPLSAFTMEDDQRMLIDIGLATIFLSAALLAAFIATNVLGREIENRTALTVISKPVSRPLFVIGKYLGVSAAIGFGAAYMSFVFLLVEQHSVLQTVRDPIHLPAIFFGVGALVLGVGAGVWCNYFYNHVFVSTTICVTTPLMGVAYLCSLMFRYDFSTQPIGTDFKPGLWLALIALFMAIMMLSAIAIAASTRLGQVMTLSVTVGMFMLGMLSDWTFGRRLDRLREQWLDTAALQGLTQREERVRTIAKVTGEVERIVEPVEVALVPLVDMATTPERIEYALYSIGYAIVPNFQVLWLSDALTQNHVIPPSYVLRVSLYALLYILLAVSLAVFLFQRREVG